MTTTQQQRPALGAMYAGLALTVVAMVAPYVDRARGNVLADHIRDGYPTYSAGRIDSAVTAWLVILSVVGALGVVTWLGTIWAVRARKAVGSVGGHHGLRARNVGGADRAPHQGHVRRCRPGPRGGLDRDGAVPGGAGGRDDAVEVRPRKARIRTHDFVGPDVRSG